MLKRFSLRKRGENAERIPSLKKEGLKGEVKVTGLSPITIKESTAKESKKKSNASEQSNARARLVREHANSRATLSLAQLPELAHMSLLQI